MYKDIIINYGTELEKYTGADLVENDVDAYRIVYRTPWDLTGCTVKALCKRADGTVVSGTGFAEGTNAVFVMNSSMYAVPGELTVRLTVCTAEEQVITVCDVTANAVESFGDGIPGTNNKTILDQILINVAKINTALEEHKADKNNPHAVTKAQVGLDNVDNAKQATKAEFDEHTTAEVLDHPDGSVTENKIADSAVTGSKIAESSIEETHLKEDVKKMLIPTIKITDSDSSGSIYKSLLIYEYDGSAPTIPMVFIDDDTVGWMYTGDAHAGLFRVVYTNGSQHIEGILEQVFDDNNNFIQILTVGTTKKYRNLGTITAGNEVYPPASWSDIITTAVDGAAIKDGTVDENKLNAALKTKLNGKADKGTKLSDYGIADAYTKSETDTKLDAKANADDVYTKTQTDTKFDAKENAANKVTEISDTSTNEQYPSAKAVNDTVKAAKTAANSIFANALKGSGSGENAVRIDDSSPIEHEMSVTVSSKNLIPYPYSNFTKTTVVNGITFTNNGDGTITANGTATSPAQIFLNSNKKLPVDCNLSYALSGCPQNGGSNIYYCDALLYNGDTLVNTVRDIGNGGIIKPATSKVWNALSYKIYIETGITVENLVFKPQIELGTTATEYTPYISDLTSVTLTQRGKNLLPYVYTDGSKTYNTMTYTRNDDGTVNIDGTSAGSQYFIANREWKLPKRIKVTHQSFSDGMTDTYYAVCSNYNGTTYVPWIKQTNKPVTMIIPSDSVSNIYKFEVLTGTSVSNKKAYPIVELGDTYTGYEPVLPEVNYTPSADGTVTGIENIYPTTTLLSDIDGVIIDVEYNRDINKAFEELKNAILSQGGNV